jgi:hypothetical protein
MTGKRFVYIAGVQRGGTTIMQCEVALVTGGVCAGEVYQTVKAIKREEFLVNKIMSIFSKRHKKKWNTQTFSEIDRRVESDTLWKSFEINKKHSFQDAYCSALDHAANAYPGSLIIDASKIEKSLSWFLEYHSTDHIDKRVLLVTRGVDDWVKSVRRYEKNDRGIFLDELELQERWVKRTKGIISAVLSSGLPYFHVHLENYAADRDNQIKAIAEFMGVGDFRLNRNKIEYHDILGNASIKEEILKTGEVSFSYVPKECSNGKNSYHSAEVRKLQSNLVRGVL